MWRSASSGSLLAVLPWGHIYCGRLTLLVSPFSTCTRALGDAEIILFPTDKLRRLPVQFVSGQCCRNYATRSSNYSTLDGTMGHQKDRKILDNMHLNNEESVEAKIGKRISSKEKRKFLINTLMDLKDSKEAVYGTLDAWVAWEQSFPLSSLKRELVVLQKAEQWHRVVQVIKWMLSKGQGKTMGTYEQLIRALEKDNRAKEAHRLWVEKISHDLHSVPWRFCELMISIYYRNNMLDRLLKLFESLEAFGRKPTSKLVVIKVGDAYEMLGLSDKKVKLLEKYDHLFSKSLDQTSRKLRKSKGVAGKDVQTSCKLRKSKGVAGKDVKKTDCKVDTSAQDTQLDSGPSDSEA